VFELRRRCINQNEARVRTTLLIIIYTTTNLVSSSMRCVILPLYLRHKCVTPCQRHEVNSLQKPCWQRRFNLKEEKPSQSKWHYHCVFRCSLLRLIFQYDSRTQYLISKCERVVAFIGFFLIWVPSSFGRLELETRFQCSLSMFFPARTSFTMYNNTLSIFTRVLG